MGLTKFYEDVNNIQSLPDNPTMLPQQLKAYFDKAGIDIKQYINSILTEEVDGKITELTNKINSIYPIGSIYMSVNNTNPGTLFGGTWVAWGAGKVPVGVNIEETEFDEVEKTGGEKTHQLVINEMPSHGHSVSIDSSGQCTTASAGNHNHDIYIINNSVSGGSARRLGTAEDSTGTRKSSVLNAGEHTHTVPNHTHTVSQSDVGEDQAHNNLQPYITCYMWKRTA